MKKLALLIALFLSIPVWAQKQDVIKLFNGTTITGTIMDDDGSVIIIKNGDKLISVNKNEIDNEQNRKEKEFGKRDTELKNAMSSKTTTANESKDCCKEVEYIKYCMGKYYKQTNTAIGLSAVGILTLGVGVFIKSPAVIYSSAGIFAIAEVVSFDSRKWIKRASLGANGFVISF